MHWLVQMATQAGWLGTDALAQSAERATSEVWPLVARAAGLSSAELAAKVAGRLRLGVADPATAEKYALRFVPVEVAQRHRVFPLRESNRELVVATSQPLDAEAEQAVSFVSGRRTVFEVAPPEVIDELLSAFFGIEIPTVGNLLDRVEAEPASTVAFVDETGPEPAQDAPVVRLTNYILHAAISQGASEVFIAPTGGTASVRLRVDGVPRHHMQLPLPALARLIPRLKSLARMNLADRVWRQHGTARVLVDGRNYDLDITVVPAGEADKAVIRIADTSMARRTLEALDLPPQELARMRPLLELREGIVLVAGPADTGRTTTLHAMLHELSARGSTVTLIEESGGAELPGVTRIQVQPRKDGSYAAALRSVTRQDSRVIALGDIADPETAAAAVRTASTGHLLLAQIRAAEAAAVVERLVELGLDRAAIAATLRGVVAQRLLRRVCRHCSVRVGDAPSTEEALLAGRYGTQPLVRAVGCPHCGDTGYRGRALASETLLLTQGLTGLLAGGANTVTLQRSAVAAGMRPLRDAALELVRSGITTLREVDRVLDLPLETAAAEPAEATPERSCILVVEDEPVQSRLARAVLENSGFAVEEAADGQIAWTQLVDKGGYSLVVTDLRMPNLDGGALLDRIRSAVTTAGIPVIVLTNVSEEDLEVELLTRGADDYIRKPLEPARFVARVKAVLRRAGGWSMLAETVPAPTVFTTNAVPEALPGPGG